MPDSFLIIRKAQRRHQNLHFLKRPREDCCMIDVIPHHNQFFPSPLSEPAAATISILTTSSSRFTVSSNSIIKNIALEEYTMTLTPDLLRALLSPDPGIRSHAETVFQSIPVVERVQDLVNQLLTLSSITTSALGNDGALPLLTAVLLRRDILKLTDTSMLNDLVDPLLKCYVDSAGQRMQIGHCLAEICSSLSMLSIPGNGNAADKASPVLAKIVSAIDPHEESSLRLLAILADRAPPAFAKIAASSIPTLVSTSNLARPTTLAHMTELLVNGAIATTLTSVSLVRATPNLDDLVVDTASPAAQLGFSLLEFFGPISTCPDESALHECLQHLSHAAITCPSLLGGQSNVLHGVVKMCLDLAVKVTATDGTIPLAALQVLSSLVSVGDVRHRILPHTLAQEIADAAIPVCAKIMAEGIDVESIYEWTTEPATLVDDGMEHDNDDVLFAEGLIESFLQNLAGPALVVAMPLVQRLLQGSPTNDWRHARAACSILESALVTAPVSLSDHVPEIVRMASSLAETSSSGGTTANPWVQYQAIRLLGALCETHSSVREMYGQIILERLAAAFASPISKVSSMACLGLVSYCRGGSNDLDAAQCLTPFLPHLLQGLLHGPLSLAGSDTGTVTVRVRAMGATACLAEASGVDFAPFYGHVMPGLLASTQIPQVDIAAAALQCVTMVGQAVGKDEFNGDARQVLSWIIPLLKVSHQTSTSPTFAIEELLVACARIAAVLEEDFAPYVDAILPSLYELAQEPPDVSVVEGTESGMQSDDDGLDGEAKSVTVAVPGRGFTRVTINTTKIQQKAAANVTLYELAKALGPSFGPYAQKSMEIFLPLVRFPYSADVRSTAAQTVSALMDTACSYGEEIGTMKIAQHYLPLLSDAISEQIALEDASDVEALYALADSLSEVYYIAFGFRNSSFGSEILEGLTIQHAEQAVKRCISTMVACLERRTTVSRILQGNLTGEDERAEYTRQVRAEDGLLKPLVDSIGYLLKFFRVEFAPLFEMYVVPVLGGYLSSTTDVRARVASICLYDDCVEYCGVDAAAKYAPSLMQGIMTVMQDPSACEKDLVQAAVYGISQMARNAPRNVMAASIQTIVYQLLLLTQGTKDEARDGIYLFEIAISALASLTLFGPFQDLKFVSRDIILNRFLDNLPISEDEDEAKVSTTRFNDSKERTKPCLPLSLSLVNLQVCHAGLCFLLENGSIQFDSDVFRITTIIAAILAAVQDGENIATADTCERLAAVAYQMHQNEPLAVQRAVAGLDPAVQNVLYAVMGDFSQRHSNVVTP